MTVTTEAAAAADANEEVTTPEAVSTEASTESVEEEPIETGGVTPEEVAAILGKDKVDTTAISEPETVEEDEEVEPDKVETPPAPVPKPDKKEEKPADTVAETATDTPDFTVQVEDANGVTHKIEKIEDLPEDFEPKNNRQIMEILRDLSVKEGEKSQYEEKQANDKAEAERQASIASIQEGWDKELEDLKAAKRIDGSKERTDAIYKFMAEENDRREKDGKPPLMLIEDVLDKLEKQEAAEAAEKAKKEAKETSRKNGALVGGSSAPASSAPAAYKAGSARNANEALRVMGIL